MNSKTRWITIFLLIELALAGSGNSIYLDFQRCSEKHYQATQ